MKKTTSNKAATPTRITTPKRSNKLLESKNKKQPLLGWHKRLLLTRYSKPAIFAIIFAAIGGTVWYVSAATPTGMISGIANKCIDVRYNQRYDGNTTWLWHCDGNPAQQWTIQSDGTIRNQGWCLDVQWAAKASRTPVWLWTCNNTAAQKWVSQSDGTLKNPNSNLCLDDQWGGTADGNALWLWPCDGNKAQRWNVPKVAAPLPTSSPAPTPKPTTQSTVTPSPTAKPAQTIDTTSAAGTFNWGATGFVEEFNGSALASNWGTYNSPGHAGNGLRRPSQITVNNGIMTQTGTSNASSAGMVMTNNHQTYGRWESRVRVTESGSGRPYHPVVALIPGSAAYHCGATDLDYYEFTVGENPYLFIHNLPSVQDYAQAPLDTSQWHNVAVELTPDHISWFIDGKVIRTDTNKAAISGVSYALNIQLDANYPSGLKTTQLQMDWTRFYPLRGNTAPPAAPAPLRGSYTGAC